MSTWEQQKELYRMLEESEIMLETLIKEDTVSSITNEINKRKKEITKLRSGITSDGSLDSLLSKIVRLFDEITALQHRLENALSSKENTFDQISQNRTYLAK